MQVSVSIATSAVKEIDKTFVTCTGRNVSEEEVARILEYILRLAVHSDTFHLDVATAIGQLGIR